MTRGSAGRRSRGAEKEKGNEQDCFASIFDSRWVDPRASFHLKVRGESIHGFLSVVILSYHRGGSSSANYARTCSPLFFNPEYLHNRSTAQITLVNPVKYLADGELNNSFVRDKGGRKSDDGR